MKLSTNELAVFEMLDSGDKIYFFQLEAKELRSNTKNLRYWDGNNWQKEEVRFLGIEKIESKKEVEYNPAYTFELIVRLVSGKTITIVTSNMSGYITPFWTRADW